MVDKRPDDWNWVQATEKCTAHAMFGRLRQVAQRNVEDRNRQLGGEERFLVTDVNARQFSVGPAGDVQSSIVFKVNDRDLVEVTGFNRIKVTYAVHLDASGVCRFRHEDGGSFDACQVFEAALEFVIVSLTLSPMLAAIAAQPLALPCCRV